MVSSKHMDHFRMGNFGCKQKKDNLATKRASIDIVTQK
jgi:hypothetical protein